MTVLVGVTALLVAASFIALVFGWAEANESLIWTSIAASAGAAVALTMAYLRARRAPASAPRSSAEPPSQAAASEVTEPDARDEAPRTGSAEAIAPAGAAARAGEPRRQTPATSARESQRGETPAPTAKKATARSRRGAPAKARAASKPRSAPKETANEVIALPDSKKFHRPECRYAKSKGAERMTKAAARRRSYAACGICKP